MNVDNRSHQSPTDFDAVMEELGVYPDERERLRLNPERALKWAALAKTMPRLHNPAGYVVSRFHSKDEPDDLLRLERLRAERENDPVVIAFRELVKQGWPTGSRFLRGSHSGTYVRDPLGYDRPTYDVPWGKPTKEEVIDALVAQCEREEREHGRKPRLVSEGTG